MRLPPEDRQGVRLQDWVAWHPSARNPGSATLLVVLRSYLVRGEALQESKDGGTPRSRGGQGMEGLPEV